MTDFSLEAIRHFGSDGPIAVVRVDDEIALYDRHGILDLMAKYKGTPALASLAEIERALLVPGDYEDLQDNDFSGQSELF